MFHWLGRRDSNPRMPGPKPGALPLGDALIGITLNYSLGLYKTAPLKANLGGF